jgi:hypothetical protein
VTRFVACILAALLTFGMASDAFGFDPCPHHGVPQAVPHTSAQAAPAAQHHAHTDTHAAPAAHHQHEHAQGKSTSPEAKHDQHGICTCMGACSVAAAIPMPVAQIHASAITRAPIAFALAPDVDAPASLHLDLLPYGIAPPTHPFR